MTACPPDTTKLDYLNGALSAERRADVDTHLEGCPTCRGEMRELGDIVADLSALPHPEPSDSLVASTKRAVVAVAAHDARACRAPIFARARGVGFRRSWPEAIAYGLVAAVPSALVVAGVVSTGEMGVFAPLWRSGADLRTVAFVVRLAGCLTLLFIPSVADNLHYQMERAARRRHAA